MQEVIAIARQIIPSSESTFVVNNIVDPVFLMHADGVDGSTSFIDATGRHLITTFGNVTVDTAQFKFGTGSALFGGTNADYLTINGDSDTAFDGDFTIHMWVRFNSVTVGVTQYLISAAPLAPVLDNSTWGITISRFFSEHFCWQISSVTVIEGTTIPAINTWYHVAVCRYAGITRLFINGIQEGDSYISSESYVAYSNRPLIGNHGNNQTTPFDGWMDELYLIKGRSLYTSNFTPPIAPSLPA